MRNFIVGIVLIILCIGLLNFFNISLPITVDNVNRSHELSMVGEGKVDVRPDMVIVDAGIAVNGASSVDEVQKTINDVSGKITAAMIKLGVAKSDITTSNYSIYPNYQSNNLISGYNGNVTVSMKIRNIGSLSQVIQEATKSGANQITGTRFVVEKPETYREAARNLAIQNAKDQANKLAKSLGIRLGKVVNVIESSPNVIYPMASEKMMGGVGMGGAPQIEPGTQTITSVVTLYFEKK